jgi:hypothetical protein
METGLGELLKKCEADRVIFQMWLKELCPTLETLRTIRKSFNNIVLKVL